MSESTLDEASSLLRSLARPGESAKSCRRRLAKALPTWTANRFRDIWRPDPRATVKAHELDQLRELVAASARVATKQQESTSLVEMVEQLQARIARLEDMLRASRAPMDR